MEIKRKVKAEFAAMVSSLPALDGLVEAIECSDAPVSVRLAPGEDADELFPGNIDDRVPWCPRGVYLKDRPAFTLDPALHQGRYYVQEASSMFVAHAVEVALKDASGPVKALDACAAPGGKTTTLIDTLPEGSLVVANEYNPKRARVLVENIIKWGTPYVVVTQGDTARLGKLKGVFDLVLVDAPCSGEGMMRKDDKAIEQWSHELVEECEARQREIVDNLWDAVAPGGVMIYSTCTFNRHENESIVEYIINSLGGENIDLEVPVGWGILPGIDTRAWCYRFVPGHTRGEGLYMAAVRKPLDGASIMKMPAFKSPRPAKEAAQLAERLADAGSMTIEINNDEATAFPTRYMPVLVALRKYCRVLHSGVTLGTRAGKGWEPSQSLALSTVLNPEAFPRVEVDRDTALDYLRRQAVTVPDGSPKGYLLLTHGGRPLGFVKNLGNRANNLYPKEWRILKQ